MCIHTVVLKMKIHILNSNCSCDYVFYNDLPFDLAFLKILKVMVCLLTGMIFLIAGIF